MNVNGSKWRYTKVYEDKWWYRDLCDGVMDVYASIWMYVKVYYGIWM